MARSNLFLEPNIIVSGCNERFTYKRFEMAVVLLNQHEILYRNVLQNSNDSVTSLDVFVQGDPGPIIITPTDEDISNYAINVDTENPLAQAKLQSMNSTGIEFSLNFKEVYNNPLTKDLMLGEPIRYKLLFTPSPK
jgi:hypothetical protein